MNKNAKPAELWTAVKVRDQLLDEASRLLAGGSGEDSPEYAEFLRLRAELPTMSRTPDLDHCQEMVRKKTKELRKWIIRLDRAAGSFDPVEAICHHISREIGRLFADGKRNEGSAFIDLLQQIRKGEIPNPEPPLPSFCQPEHPCGEDSCLRCEGRTA